MKKIIGVLLLIFVPSSTYLCREQSKTHWKLTVSGYGRFLLHDDGTPFFWLADSGWLLFKKLDGEPS